MHNVNKYLLLVFRLLDILAGRKNKAGLSGNVLVNGQQQPSNFKCISGYVVQVSLLYDYDVFVCLPEPAIVTEVRHGIWTMRVLPLSLVM